MSADSEKPLKVRGRIPSLIFGPVDSRRYGRSLGVNLLPADRKICNYNCPYCECGWTEVAASRSPVDPALFPAAEEILVDLEADLEARRARGERIDTITLAGNGEPTLHPEFSRIAEAVRAMRDRIYPRARLVLLSDAANLHVPDVRVGIGAFDVKVMKLDAGTEAGFRAVNMPVDKVTLASVVAEMATLRGIVLQAMFVRGRVDNTTEEEVAAWVHLVARIRPESVQVYSLDRETPDPALARVPADVLRAIAERVTRETGVPAEWY
jgi:wyosine [tRNA(Phe)-imidazoG37] synthetase (radical SAM superfamily)